MNEHYDVCVAGFWYGENYGSLLNGYAEYRILKSLGKSVLMLQKPKENKQDVPDEEITKGHNVNFFSEYYRSDEVSEQMCYEDLKNLNVICDCFIAGSDQIWNYHLSFHENLYLPFVNADKRLISFSTSFGHKNDMVPETARKRIKEYLQRYDAISVREQFDVDILRNNYSINGTLLFEPVFCVDRSVYDELAKSSQYKAETPYLLTYILDPTPQKREAILFYTEKLKIKVINILDGQKAMWQRNKDILNLPNTLKDVSVQDFVQAFKNASYVITDSFHGSAFSIIFNKPFFAIGNYGRGFERFTDLLSRLKLLDRLVIDNENIPHDMRYLAPIDYTEINSIISKEGERTVKWLKNALETPKEKLPSIIHSSPNNAVNESIDMKNCMGCGACFNICPVNAIDLIPDEYGYYKAKLDIEKCINCGKCSSVCPAKELPENHNSDTPECYEIVAADTDILFKSSSGGAFSLLAEQTFKQSGCVLGAAWKDDFSVEHIMIDSEQDMYKLRKSKYLQSYMGKTYTAVKEQLESGRFVLFSGCPCQAAGLRKFLKKDYDNLLIVDLLCGNAPSADFFKKYIVNSYGHNLKSYEFRNKTNGWNPTAVEVTYKNGKKEILNGEKDSNYQRVYHNHAMCSIHCQNCKYQNVPKIGDITIGDFWWIKEHEPNLDTSKGVSALLINNEKGKKFFEQIPQDKMLVRKKVPFEWLKGNGFTVKGTKNFVSPKRDDFYSAIRTMPFGEAVNYALKPNHGIISSQPLNYFSKLSGFSYDKTIWDEQRLNGLALFTTKEKFPKTGKYLSLRLSERLVKGKEYLFRIRFKVMTESKIYNFHVKSAGESLFQVIHTHMVTEENKGKWIEIHKTFIPDSDIYDEFMVGAAQLSGEDRLLFIDYIEIK